MDWTSGHWTVQLSTTSTRKTRQSALNKCLYNVSTPCSVSQSLFTKYKSNADIIMLQAEASLFGLFRSRKITVQPLTSFDVGKHLFGKMLLRMASTDSERRCVAMLARLTLVMLYMTADSFCSKQQCSIDQVGLNSPDTRSSADSQFPGEKLNWPQLPYISSNSTSQCGD